MARSLLPLFIVVIIFHVQLLPVQAGSGSQRRSPITILEQTPGSITVRISTDRLRSKTISREGTDFQVLGVEGFGYLHEIGLPMLPGKSEYLATAPGSPIRITILRSDVRRLEGIQIYPAQEPRTAVAGETRDYPFRINRQFYRNNGFYPHSPVRTARTVDYRGIPMTRIRFTPLLYNAALRQLKWYKNLVVKLEYRPLRPGGRIGKRSLELVQHRVLNGNSPALRRPLLKTAARQDDAETDVVIVTINEFTDAANAMAKWQRMKGYDVHIEARDRWTTGQVKDFVHDLYDNCSPAPGYLLIIGDQEDVPGQGAIDDGIPYMTDLYYTTMGGRGDYMPEMARGRISPANAREAMVIVNKNINYEKNPPEKTSFYNNALSCGYFQDYGEDGMPNYADRRFAETVEEVKTYLNDYDINSERVYYTEKSNNPLYWNKTAFSFGESVPEELRKPNFAWDGGKEDIARGINEGVFLIYHYDHGFEYGWADPEFTTSDIHLLHNGDLLPIIFSLDCLVGAYDFREPCFAEEITRMENAGAVGIVAAASETYSGPNEALLLGMIDAIWPGIVLSTRRYPNPEVTEHASVHRMGDVLDQGFFRMTETWPELEQVHCEMYHYFGDPTLRIWTGRPKEITVTHAETIALGAEGFTLSNSNMEEGMAVLLHEESGAITGRTEISRGDVSIPLPNSLKEGDELTLILTGHNYRPYIRNLGVGFIVGIEDLRQDAVSLEVLGSKMRLHVPGPGDLRVLVYRPSGEIRHRLTMADFSGGGGPVELDLGSGGPGVYFVEVDIGEKKLCRTISVLR